METQFLLLELEGGPAEGEDEGSSSSAAAATNPAYGLLLPLIDGGRFRATLRPPRWVVWSH